MKVNSVPSIKKIELQCRCIRAHVKGFSIPLIPFKYQVRETHDLSYAELNWFSSPHIFFLNKNFDFEFDFIWNKTTGHWIYCYVTAAAPACRFSQILDDWTENCGSRQAQLWVPCFRFMQPLTSSQVWCSNHFVHKEILVNSACSLRSFSRWLVRSVSRPKAFAYS